MARPGDLSANWYVRFPLREGGEKDGAPTANIDTAKQWALIHYGAVLNAVRKGDVGSLFDKTLDEVISEYVAEVKMDPTRGKSAIKWIGLTSHGCLLPRRPSIRD